MTTMEAAVGGRGRKDWRLRISVAFTVTWVALGLLYISNVVGWTDFVSQRAPELGGFLEGAFAPLAFLWLVVGFFLQQQQLEQNTKTIEAQLVVMRQTAEQHEVQARAIAADELHSRQDTFLRVADIVNEQLGVVSGFIIMSWAADFPEKMSDPDGPLSLWKSLGGGDTAAFSRHVFSLFYSNQVTPAELFWGTEIRSQHTRNFITAFERMLRKAEKCDPDGAIADALRQGSHGRVFRFMKETEPSK
jgi:hypothetical protein